MKAKRGEPAVKKADVGNVHFCLRTLPQERRTPLVTVVGQPILGNQFSSPFSCYSLFGEVVGDFCVNFAPFFVCSLPIFATCLPFSGLLCNMFAFGGFNHRHPNPSGFYVYNPSIVNPGIC